MPRDWKTPDFPDGATGGGGGRDDLAERMARAIEEGAPMLREALREWLEDALREVEPPGME